MSAFATIEDVKAYLGITRTDKDEIIGRLVLAVSAHIEKVCCRSFAVQTYIDNFRPAGQASIFLKHGPVTAFTNLMAGSQVLDEAKYYRDGRVVALESGAVFGREAVVATYQAGYATIPEPIKQACIETVALRVREMDRIGEQSKSVAGESTSYIISDLPPSARALIAPFKEVALG